MLKNSQTNANELLDFIIKNNIINMDDVEKDMQKEKSKQILSEIHKYQITQSKDGRWRTYIPDPNSKNGRRQIAKSTEEKIYKFDIINFLFSLHNIPLFYTKYIFALKRYYKYIFNYLFL